MRLQRGPGRAGRNWLMHLMETDPEDLPGDEADATSAPGPQRASEPAPEPEPEPPADRRRPSPPAQDSGFPARVEPMLAQLTAESSFGPEEGWAFEMKWDGVRVLAYLEQGRVELRSRRGRDDTAAYADVAAALTDVPARSADRIGP